MKLDFRSFKDRSEAGRLGSKEAHQLLPLLPTKTEARCEDLDTQLFVVAAYKGIFAIEIEAISANRPARDIPREILTKASFVDMFIFFGIQYKIPSSILSTNK